LQKMESVKEPQVAEPVETVKVEVVNDSSEGLARMYLDLEPLALRVRSAACTLFLFSLFFFGSLEGMFGLGASLCILVFAAPGSLGTAYASRCARYLAIFAASLALFHLLALSAFSFVVLPEVPAQVAKLCESSRAREVASLHHDTTKPEAVAHIDLHDLLLQGRAFAATPGGAEAHHHDEHHHDAHHKAHLLGEDEATYSPNAITPVVQGVTAEVAQLTAAYSSKAARKLQQVIAVAAPRMAGSPAELAEHCDHVSHFFANVAPAMLLAAAIWEFGLFFAAYTLAKRTALLVRTARRYGANAI